MNLRINNNIVLSENEIEVCAIHAQGKGGQNVNKVATAIHLRFNISTSSLPESCKNKLLQLKDRRISKEGVIVIKAQRYRSQDKNREDAFNRLVLLVKKAMVIRKKRKPTQATASSKRKRLDSKSKQSKLKQLRSRIRYDED